MAKFINRFSLVVDIDLGLADKFLYDKTSTVVLTKVKR